MTWIYVAIGIVFLLAINQLRAALSFEFPVNRIHRDSPPDASVAGGYDLLNRRAEDYRAAGFDAPVWFELQPLSGTSLPSSHFAVFVHKDRSVLAWLGPAIYADGPQVLQTFYVSQLASGAMVVSQVSDPYFELFADDDLRAQTLSPAAVERELAMHRDFVKRCLDTGDTAIDVSHVGRLAEELLNGSRERRLRQGQLREQNGIARPTWRFGIAILRKLRANRKRLRASGAPVPPRRLAHIAAAVHRNTLRKPSGRDQWILFVGSMLLSVLIAWPLFGLPVAVLLTAVIGFHEFGHWLAMWALGYRNLNITFLPLLGGVAMGYEGVPSAARRAWVALAGPLPGIVAGWALLVALAAGWLAPGTAVIATALMLLAINYLNVLPIPPLDGAHVLRAALPARWPTAHASVLLIGVGIGVLAAAWLEFWPLAAIAALQLFGVRALWTNADHIRHLATHANRSRFGRTATPRAALFEALDARLGPATDAATRIGLANTLQQQLRTSPMSGWQRTLVLTSYAAVFILPAWLVASGWRSGDDLFESLDYSGQAHEIAMALDAYENELRAMPLRELLVVISDEPLQAPASDDALLAAEQRLGQRLPTDLATLYRAANGVPVPDWHRQACVGRATR